MLESLDSDDERVLPVPRDGCLRPAPRHRRPARVATFGSARTTSTCGCEPALRSATAPSARGARAAGRPPRSTSSSGAVGLRVRPDPPRAGPAPARARLAHPGAQGREPRPRDVVAPAGPCGRVAPVRAGLTQRAGRAGTRPFHGLLARRPPRRVDRPGGHGPRPGRRGVASTSPASRGCRAAFRGACVPGGARSRRNDVRIVANLRRIEQCPPPRTTPPGPSPSRASPATSAAALVPELLDAGYQVRAIARNPDRLRDRPWRSQIEVAAGRRQRARPDPRGAARGGRRVLPHPLARHGPHLRGARPAGALNFGRRAREAGVRRIVYLGGLYPEGEELSPHLRVPQGGRRHPARLGRADRPCCGRRSSSARDRVVRDDALPHRAAAGDDRAAWVKNRIQPIAIRDVLRYLVGAAEMPAEVSRAFDIGGPDVLTYREMMQRLRQGGRPAAARHRLRPGADAAAVQPLGGLVTPVPPRHRPAAGRERSSTRSSAASTTSPSTSPTRPRA